MRVPYLLPWKKHCRVQTTSESWMFMLPDDILISIISNLNLKEAARTSVLSRRWRDLWTFTTGVLDFAKPVRKILPAYMEDEFTETETQKFIDRVNLVLDQLKCSSVDEFQVSFVLDQRNSDVINCWIKFALKRHVKRLVLDFGSFKIFPEHANYALGTQILSCGCDSLTAIHLIHVDVTGEVLMYILTRFSQLEELHVEHSTSLIELKVDAPLPRLRRLKIMQCLSMRCLEIHAANLVSFAYGGPEIRMSFKEIPDLLEANIDGIIFKKYLCHFPGYFSQLESFVLNLAALPFATESFPKLPLFGKLKKLELSFSGLNPDVSVVCCTKLLMAAPILQSFVLKMHGIREDNRKLARRNFKFEHKLLKVVKFIDFRGSREHVKLVKCLVAKFPCLEKVVISPIPARRHPFLRMLPYIDAINAAEQLRNSLPPGAELVILRHHL